MERDRIIRVSGCHDCCWRFKYHLLWLCCKDKGKYNITDEVYNKTIHPDCKLDKQEDKSDLVAKLREAESRLKTWLAVREDELYYARLDATKHIRAVWAKYDGILKYSDKYIMMEIWQAINADIKQAEGESGK